MLQTKMKVFNHLYIYKKLKYKIPRKGPGMLRRGKFGENWIPECETSTDR